MDIKLFCQVLWYETRKFWAGLGIILCVIGLGYGAGRFVLSFSTVPISNFDLHLKSVLLGFLLLVIASILSWLFYNLYLSVISKIDDIQVAYIRATNRKKERLIMEQRDKEAKEKVQ